MVIDNAFDDNVKIVFDLTNAAPLTRRGTDILAVDNHLEGAEEKKRSSPAWANFVPLDGLTSEFVPFALGWYGDMGEADYKVGAIAPRLDFVSRWVVGVAESPLRSLM